MSTATFPRSDLRRDYETPIAAKIVVPIRNGKHSMLETSEEMARRTHLERIFAAIDDLGRRELLQA